MQDTILRNNGKSKTIKAPSDMPATYDAWRTQLIAGNGHLDVIQNTATSGDDSGVSQLGTALSKANMLSDATATKVGLTSSATVNDIINTLIPRVVSVSLPTASWIGSASPYTQVVSIVSATTHTKVDTQASSTVIEQMSEDGTTAIYADNTNGTITYYAIGEKPTVDITVQATLTEVDT